MVALVGLGQVFFTVSQTSKYSSIHSNMYPVHPIYKAASKSNIVMESYKTHIYTYSPAPLYNYLKVSSTVIRHQESNPKPVYLELCSMELTLRKALDCTVSLLSVYRTAALFSVEENKYSTTGKKSVKSINEKCQLPKPFWNNRRVSPWVQTMACYHYFCAHRLWCLSSMRAGA